MGPETDPAKDPDWAKVRRTVKPLNIAADKKAKRAMPQSPASGPPVLKPRVRPAAAPSPASLPPTKPTITEKPDTHIRADKKTRRGKIIIDRKIDLHDMTYDAAYEALSLAVIRASNTAKPVLLVVTGKGRGGEGVLRRAFPQWMNDPALKPYIQSYAPAHLRHGGGGAWYVFVRPRPKQ